MFTLRQEQPAIRIILWVILVSFFLLGVFSVFYYGDAFLLGSLETFDNDDVKYIRSAWILLDTGVFTYKNVNEPTVFIMPGLTFTLAFFMLFFGKSGGIVAFKLFAVFLQTLSIYLLFLIGRKAFNSKVAIIACLINFAYVVDFWVSHLILTESIFKFLFLLLIYVSLYAVELKKKSLYILGALIWTLAIYLRPTIGAFPLLILFLWIKEKYTWREMIKFASIVLAIFILLMSPWWIRNYITFDRFIPLTLSSGNPFLQGTYINYDQSKDFVPYAIGKNEIETDQIEKNVGIFRLKTYVPKEPLAYLYWYTIGKSIKFWAKPFYWQSIFSIPYTAVYRIHQLLLTFGGMGIILSLITAIKRKSHRTPVPYHGFYPCYLILIMLYFNLVYLPYYTFARYAYPVIPLLILLSSYSLSVILKFIFKPADSKTTKRR